MNEEYFITKCAACQTSVSVPVSATRVVCPQCGFTWATDARTTYERFKRLIRTVYGTAPEKPENN